MGPYPPFQTERMNERNISLLYITEEEHGCFFERSGAAEGGEANEFPFFWDNFRTRSCNGFRV